MSEHVTNDPELYRLIRDADTPWHADVRPGSSTTTIRTALLGRVVARGVEPWAAKTIVAAVNKVQELQDRVEVRELTDRAKAKLTEQGWSEPDAHSFLRRYAMERRVRIKVVAEQVLADPAFPDAVTARGARKRRRNLE